jgi:hypothetical protein
MKVKCHFSFYLKSCVFNYVQTSRLYPWSNLRVWFENPPDLTARCFAKDLWDKEKKFFQNLHFTFWLSAALIETAVWRLAKKTCELTNTAAQEAVETPSDRFAKEQTKLPL